MPWRHQEPPGVLVETFKSGRVYLDWSRAAGTCALTDEGQEPVLGEAEGAFFETDYVDVDLAKEVFVPGHPCLPWRHQN